MQNYFDLIADLQQKLVKELPFPVSEYKQRLDQVRKLMEQREVDVLLVYTPENIYYLSGHDSPGYYSYQCLVVTREQDPILILRKTEELNSRTCSWIDEFATFQDEEDPIEKTVAVLSTLKRDKGVIAVEKDSWFLTVQHFERLRRLLTDAHLVNSDALVEKCRLIKSDREVEYIRSAARIADDGMKVGIEMAEPGVTEDELAAEILRRTTIDGGEYTGLPPFVTSGPRTATMHGTWKGRKLQKGDVVYLEIPGCVKRYHAAVMRTGVIGNPSEDLERKAEIAISALDAQMKSIRPGGTPEAVCEAAYHVIERAGCLQNSPGRGHRRGYSIGIAYPPDWGEGNIMSLGPRIWGIGPETGVFKTNMTFHTISWLGVPFNWIVGFSETVLVTESDHECLTNVDRKLFIK